MKTFFKFLFLLLCILLWYYAFIYFLNTFWDSKFLCLQDVRLWGLWLVAAYYSMVIEDKD